MLDLGKLVGKSVTPAEITIDGITLVGNNSAGGFVPHKVTVSEATIVELVKRKLEELGISGMKMDVSLTTRPVGDQWEPEYVGAGAVVTLTKV